METFGKRLKHLIRTSEWRTNKAFSEEVGFSEQTLSKLIQGVNNPSYEFLMRIESIFNQEKLSWLLFGRAVHEELQLENEYLKERLQLSENKISRLAKYSSNRVSPQIPFPEFIPVYNG